MTTTSRTADREALFRKIRALLAKTTEANCTEAEALAAAGLARRLMDDYNIAHTDLNDDEPFTDTHFPWGSPGSRTRKRNAWRLRTEIAFTIATYTDTRARLNTDHGLIKYFGRESDVLFAGWLLESLDAFGLRAWSLFEAAQSLIDDPDTTRPDRESFLHGYATRINERLLEEATTRTAPATGNALVLNRRALVDDEYARRFAGKLTRWRGQTGRIADAASVAAGSAAGNRAGFHRPMAGGRGPVLIGH